MPSILVTGSSRGLGLEFVRQYAQEGWRVFATCRAPGQAKALLELAARHDRISVHPLEVGNATSVARLAQALEGVSVDVLLNNAGLLGPEPQVFGRLDYDAWAEVMRVNAFGVMQMCEAFVGHVERSDKKLIVAISSGLASIADCDGGYHLYRASKAALNMIVHNLALELKARGIVACVVNPGWIRTDMGTPRAPLSPEEGIQALRRCFARITLEDSGKFLNSAGGICEW